MRRILLEVRGPDCPPMLVLAGEKAFGNFLIEQGRLVASNVNDIIQGSGHWLMEEAPQQTIPALVNFINGPM